MYLCAPPQLSSLEEVMGHTAWPLITMLTRPAAAPHTSFQMRLMLAVRCATKHSRASLVAPPGLLGCSKEMELGQLLMPCDS